MILPVPIGTLFVQGEKETMSKIHIAIILPLSQCTKSHCSVCRIRNINNKTFKVKVFTTNFRARKDAKISFQKKIIFDVPNFTS